MYRLELMIMGLPKMTNANNSHWRARMAEARKWKDLVHKAVLRERIRMTEANVMDIQYAPRLKKAKITITRFSSKMPDFDGCVSAGKHLLDGLKQAEVIIDDNPLIIGQPIYLWEKTNPKNGHVKIVVEEVA